MADSFQLKTSNKFLGIGNQYPIRVNCNIGINNSGNYKNEVIKIDELLRTKESSPDLMMDLSTIRLTKPLYQYIIDNYGLAVGTLPVYLCYSKNEGISKKRLLELLEEQAKQGVAFFTLHFTADLELYEIAKKSRLIPLTSRGGGMVLRDSFLNKRDSNILIECFDEIVSIVKKNNIAISLGTTFRPAGIVDALDEVHLLETHKQLELCQKLKALGVNVIVENIGHIDLSSIEKHSELLRRFYAPIMPLGPLPTDNAEGNDHIASAIGGAFAGFNNSANILNSISPNEHLNSDIKIKDSINGIIAAKIAAHSVNITRFSDLREIDDEIYKRRGEELSCISKSKGNCERCDEFCPLKIMSK